MRAVFFFIIWCLTVSYGYGQESRKPQVENKSKTKALEEKSDFKLSDAEREEMESKIGFYGELDFGIPLLLFPHNSLFNTYKDADNNLGFRVAASISYGRFRFELGYLKRFMNQGEHDITSHNDVFVSESTSEADMTQIETLLYWLRNDSHRISYIGGGPIQVRVEETFTFQTTSGSTTSDQTTKGNGWKLVVGKKDTDSRLKTFFSYTHAKIDPKIGTNYYIGGYSFGINLSFGGP